MLFRSDLASLALFSHVLLLSLHVVRSLVALDVLLLIFCLLLLSNWQRLPVSRLVFKRRLVPSYQIHLLWPQQSSQL